MDQGKLNARRPNKILNKITLLCVLQDECACHVLFLHSEFKIMWKCQNWVLILVDISPPAPGVPGITGIYLS